MILKSLKEGRTPDLSDYKDFKLSAENLGFKLLQKLGWQQGQGLGKANQGIVEPVNKYINLLFLILTQIVSFSDTMSIIIPHFIPLYLLHTKILIE